jgi:hypothetical protein
MDIQGYQGNQGTFVYLCDIQMSHFMTLFDFCGHLRIKCEM